MVELLESTYLIEKDVFPVCSLGGVFFEDPFRGDAVFGAELLPKLHPDLVAALSHLNRDDLTRHVDKTV